MVTNFWKATGTTTLIFSKYANVGKFKENAKIKQCPQSPQNIQPYTIWFKSTGNCVIESPPPSRKGNLKNYRQNLMPII